MTGNLQGSNKEVINGAKFQEWENNGPLENASSATGKFEKSPVSKFKGILCLAKGEQRNIGCLRKEKDKAQQTKPF